MFKAEANYSKIQNLATIGMSEIVNESLMVKLPVTKKGYCPLHCRS
ncbi:hypothetical protein BH10BAC4_BH10BAC4_26180 [soil metagenome]